MNEDKPGDIQLPGKTEKTDATFKETSNPNANLKTLPKQKGAE